MSDDLGARLMQAGLVTREQLSSVLGSAPPHEGALVEALVREGTSEDAIAGFFVANGFGPMMDAQDLSSAHVDAVRSLPARMATELLALPVRASPAGLIVAMAAPTDAHAIAEISRAVRAAVLPIVARVTELVDALREAYPNAAEDAPPSSDSEPPVELVHRRQPGYQSSTRGVDRVEARALVGPRLMIEDDEGVVPLVRHKPLAPAPAKPKVITKSFERPAEQAEAARAVEPRKPATLPPRARKPTPPIAKTPSRPPIAKTPSKPPSAIAERPAATKIPAAPPSALPASAAPKAKTPPPPPPAALAVKPPVSPKPYAPGTRGSGSPPPPDAKKSALAKEDTSWEPDTKVDPNKLRTLSSPPKRSMRPPAIGSTLAAIRASRDRDEVVDLACRGAVTVCRAALLLALKKDVLKGWDGAGDKLSKDAVRNLWIPTKSPSMFRNVVAKHEPYYGPHGTSAADGLFRAAVGSRGGEVALQPVAVGGKVVAVLAADDVAFEREGAERIEVLARAIGEAFERIIVAGKAR